MIKIIYHASLKRNDNDVIGIIKTTLEFQEGMTIKQIADSLDLDEVGLIILNGVLAMECTIVKDQDCIEIHPFFGGG